MDIVWVKKRARLQTSYDIMHLQCRKKDFDDVFAEECFLCAMLETETNNGIFLYK
jgi:hypothetical protein